MSPHNQNISSHFRIRSSTIPAFSSLLLPAINAWLMRNATQGAGVALVRVWCTRRLERDSRLDATGDILCSIGPEIAALAMGDHDAAFEAVNERVVCVLGNRIVATPTCHELIHERFHIRHRKTDAIMRTTSDRIGTPGTRRAEAKRFFPRLACRAEVRRVGIDLGLRRP